MEQAMILQIQPNQFRGNVKAVKGALCMAWVCIKGLLEGIVTAMFVPSKADRQIEEGRQRVRELMSRCY